MKCADDTDSAWKNKQKDSGEVTELSNAVDNSSKNFCIKMELVGWK